MWSDAAVSGLRQRAISSLRDQPSIATVLVCVCLAVLAVGVPIPLVLVLLVVMVAATAWRPAAAVSAVPMTLPFGPLTLQIGPAAFSVIEVALLTTASGVMVYGLRQAVRRGSLQGGCREARRLLQEAQFVPLAVAILAVGTVSLGTIADPTHLRESLRFWRWIVVEPVVFYGMALWFLRSEQDAGRLVRVWVGAAAAAAALCLVQWSVGGGLTVEGVRRLTGFYPHPNAAALTLERPALAALSLALASGGRHHRWWWLAAAVTGVATVLTFSRGALLALLLGLFALLWLLRRYRVAVSLLVGSLFSLILGFAAFPDRLSAGILAGGDSLRLAIWRSSVAMLADRPLTGVGIDQFLYQYVPRYVEPVAWPERFTSHPHNVVLEVWLHFGLTGLVVLGSAGWLVVRAVRRSRHWPLGVAAGISLLGGFVHGWVDRTFFAPELALAFWLAAVILELPRTARSAAVDTRRTPCECW
ncbi:MAG: O-antigen ligase family protein [Thermomicrobium sp.]|nr:O-antigen ligase family protein [Thermomicrobium sp.]MDW7981789.1 O-antigen ligase family protein [Thermomicrobium sp.]